MKYLFFAFFAFLIFGFVACADPPERIYQDVNGADVFSYPFTVPDTGITVQIGCAVHGYKKGNQPGYACYAAYSGDENEVLDFIDEIEVSVYGRAKEDAAGEIEGTSKSFEIKAGKARSESGFTAKEDYELTNIVEFELQYFSDTLNVIVIFENILE
jgi:hypothetical protein